VTGGLAVHQPNIARVWRGDDVSRRGAYNHGPFRPQAGSRL